VKNKQMIHKKGGFSTMEKGTIYHFGYAGRKPEELDTLARSGALILDVRFSPYSRCREWNLAALKARLGDSYKHVQGFGNKNYRGGPIELLNPVPEVNRFKLEIDEGRSIVVMCMCKSFEHCHRKNVVQMLQTSTGARVFDALSGVEEKLD
jgi:hypothetical protein